MIEYHKNLGIYNTNNCQITTTLIIMDLYEKYNGKNVDNSINIITNNWIKIK